MAFILRATTLAMLTLCAAAALAHTVSASELTLKRVLLSTGGVGYFEHEAQVSGNVTLSLDLPLDQIDDVLKSVVVFDDKGGVGTVRLPGREPLSELFRELPIRPEALNSVPELLAALKGAPVTVSGKRALNGRVIAVETETIALPDGVGTTTRHRVSLMTAEGVQQFLLEEQDAVRFADAALEAAIGAALEGIATHRVRDRRTVEIEARGTGERLVRVGYVVGAPLWKASYRLTIGGEKGNLQGWAHLENLSGRAWNNVELTLVAGNPVTFRQALYTAYFVSRPEVPVEVLGRVLPPADEGAVALGGPPAPQAEAKMMARAAPEPAPGMADFAGSAMASAELARDYDAGDGSPPAPSPSVAQGAIATDREDAATQVIMRLAEPITLAPGQSLSVPVIDAAVPADRIALYDPGVHARHPLAAVGLDNATGSGLPPGVLTLYERNAGGTAYVGDARLSTLPAGEERMLSFAIDSSITVDRENSSVRNVASTKISQGMLHFTMRESEVTRYRIKSAASDKRHLIVEHPRRAGWDLVASAMVTSLSETAHRLPFDLEPGASFETDVTLERTIAETYALSDFTPDMLVYYADTQGISPAVKQALKALSLKRAEIETTRQRVIRLEESNARLLEEQRRLRDSLGLVPSESDLHARYLKKLAAQEDEIEKLAVELAVAREQLVAAEAAYAESIRGLDV